MAKTIKKDGLYWDEIKQEQKTINKFLKYNSEPGKTMIKFIKRQWKKLVIWYKMRELKKQDPFIYEDK